MRGKSGKAGGRNAEITIIRREEVTEAGRHGGAWKVAYADFVTAMMAFFLLMWLLNATTEDQRKGLADYFSPNNLLSHASSGTGRPFGGHTAFDTGAMVSDRGAVQVIVGKRPVVQDPEEDDADTPLTAPSTGPAQTMTVDQATGETPGGAAAPGAPRAGTPPTAPPPSQAVQPAPPPTKAAPAAATAVARPVEVKRVPTEAELAAVREAKEKQAFQQAAKELREAVQADPALATLSRQLAIDITPEGLRIQMLDEDHSAMFATGSSTLNERAQLLLTKVAQVLARLPEDIAVVGHTDAAPFAGHGKTNWELSTERANATRRLLVDQGLSPSRVSRITGLADRDPLLPADPFAAANRRIAIIVLRGTTKPAAMPAARAPVAPAAAPAAPSTPAPPATPPAPQPNP